MADIYIRISPGGDVTVEARGYTGKSCVSATKPFEEAVGVVTKRKHKMEYLSEVCEGETGNKSDNGISAAQRADA